ncbi:MAG: hypothetical protein P4N59_13205 [Negativicutes bacterium]|nr:hypothetical protein [Negativicutes bacterium]
MPFTPAYRAILIRESERFLDNELLFILDHRQAYNYTRAIEELGGQSTIHLGQAAAWLEHAKARCMSATDLPHYNYHIAQAIGWASR